MKVESIKQSALHLFLKHREALKQKEIEHYEGEGVYCPLCKSSFRSFALGYGTAAEKHVRCPKCETVERHRLLWKYLHEMTDFFDGIPKRVLHFAPERFFFDHFSGLQNLEYIPCDLYPEKYEKHYQGKLVKADVTDLPFEDNSFDVILCYHIFEHIPDDKKAMQEVSRVMKNGGWGIFQVPIDYSRETTYEDFSITTPEEREKAFGQDDHVRWYGRDYGFRLKRVGFQVNEDPYVKTLSSEEIFRLGLDPDEIVYYCTK